MTSETDKLADPDQFEAWWATSPRRNREQIGYSAKKILAYEAFSAGLARTPSTGMGAREILAAQIENLEQKSAAKIRAGDSSPLGTIYIDDALRAIESALRSPGMEEAKRLLRFTLEAVESGRSEPLFIARDAIRNYFEDQLAALSPATPKE